MAKKKKSKFRNKVNQDVKRQKAAGSNYGYLRLPKGVNVYAPSAEHKEKFDVIPYIVTDGKHPDRNEEADIATVGEPWYKRPFRVHKQVGVDNDTVVCLQSFGKKCPICEYRKVEAKKGEMDKDELKAFNSSRRNLYLVIPRDVKKFEEEIHIFDYSQFLWQDVLNEDIEEDEDNEVFPDIEEGLTLETKWTEDSYGKVKFFKASRIYFRKRDEEIDPDIIDNVPDLDTLLIELSYAELNNKFFEIDEETAEKESPFKDDEENDEDTKPARTRKSNKNKKPEPEPEPEEVSVEDLMDMDLEELKECAEANDVDPDDYLQEDESDILNSKWLRTGIAEELDIELPKKKKEKKKEKGEKKGKTKSKVDKCPHGHKYGIDTDEGDAVVDCDTCDLWDECLTAKENK